MDWFTEYYNGCGLAIKVTGKIAQQTGVQKVEVYETESFGRMLVIDGKIQLTEFDEAFYHEMLVHVPMLTHASPRNVLIIGGGDGGALREVLKHDVTKVTLVEVDRSVIELCREHVRIDAGSFTDDRVEIVIRDGKDFLADCGRYDVIIVDSTDPVSVSATLFDKEFFDAAAAKCDVFCCQAQSPLIQKEYFSMLLRNSKAFGSRKVYLGYVPTYPLGLWSYMIAGDIDGFFEERFEKIRGKTRYYNPEVHRAAFALPEWLRKEVEDVLNE